MKLTAEQEELASFYASMPEDGPQLGNPKTRPVFQQNFFKDFQETFPPGVVKKFSSCDFADIKEYLDRQKLVKKAASNEEKAVVKAEKDKVLTYPLTHSLTRSFTHLLTLTVNSETWLCPHRRSHGEDGQLQHGTSWAFPRSW